MAQKWPKMAQKLAPAEKIAQIYLQDLQLFASLHSQAKTVIIFFSLIYTQPQLSKKEPNLLWDGMDWMLSIKSETRSEGFQ